jgi:hypothetical protein
VRNETTRSVPPYIFGGTLSYRGDTCAIFTGASRWAEVTPISTTSVSFLVVEEYPVNPVEKIKWLDKLHLKFESFE